MEHCFYISGNRDFYSCELPGSRLIEAQHTNVVIPAHEHGEINLSTIEWYDAEQPGPNYHDITDLKFDKDARYTVRYVFSAAGQPCKTAYLFAVKNVFPFAPRQTA